MVQKYYLELEVFWGLVLQNPLSVVILAFNSYL